MTHYELCRITAGKFCKKAWMALYEYQSFACGEFPDVLVYGANGTVLYEIKMNRSDFLADFKKEARTKWKPKGYVRYQSDWETEKCLVSWINENPELYYIQKPHLGNKRYYVCESGLIDAKEVPEGWGLYWYDGSRFYNKRESKKWRADVHSERNLAVHAMRRFISGNMLGIMVQNYEGEVINA